MMRSATLMAILMLIMSGCTAYRNDSLQRLQTLPEHYNQFDAQVAWEVRNDRDSTVIDGVVKNIRYFEMSDLEMRVFVLDANGKELHRGVDFILQLKENEAGPFTIRIPKAAPGTRLQFLYSYLGINGDSESADAVSWSQSFEARVP